MLRSIFKNIHNCILLHFIHLSLTVLCGLVCGQKLNISISSNPEGQIGGIPSGGTFSVVQNYAQMQFWFCEIMVNAFDSAWLELWHHRILPILSHGYAGHQIYMILQHWKSGAPSQNIIGVKSHNNGQKKNLESRKQKQKLVGSLYN